MHQCVKEIDDLPNTSSYNLIEIYLPSLQVWFNPAVIVTLRASERRAAKAIITRSTNLSGDMLKIDETFKI